MSTTDPAPDIMHDPWLTPKDGSRLAHLAEETFLEAETLRPPTGRKPRADALETRRAVIANLIANLSLCVAWGQRLAVSAARAARTRYDRPGFRPALLVEAGRALEAAGLAKVEPPEFKKRRTGLVPTEALREALGEGGGLGDVGRAPGAETIVLKQAGGSEGTNTATKPLIDYRDTPLSRKLRADINSATVTLEGSHPEAGAPIHLTRHFHTTGSARLFPSQLRYGRLWGGDWEVLERTERHRLRINGEPLVEVDWSGCFVRLAYLHVGLQFPEGDDPYAGVEGLEFGDSVLAPEVAARRRDAVKVGLSALLHASKPIGRIPRGLHGIPECAGWSGQRLTEAISKRHPAIAPLFGTGVGAGALAMAESNMLVAVLLRLRDLGIVAVLPLHDAVLAPVSKAPVVVATMEEISEEILGVRLPVKVKQGGA